MFPLQDELVAVASDKFDVHGLRAFRSPDILDLVRVVGRVGHCQHGCWGREGGREGGRERKEGRRGGGEEGRVEGTAIVGETVRRKEERMKRGENRRKGREGREVYTCIY